MPYPGSSRDPSAKPEWGSQIDLSNPLTQGLVLASPFLESGDPTTANLMFEPGSGTLNSGVSWGATPSGSALSFNGTSGAVSYASAGYLSAKLSAAPALTVSAWVSTATLSGGGPYNVRAILNVGNKTYNSGAAVLELRLTTASPHFDFTVGGAGFYTTSTANNSVLANTWYHVVGTYGNSSAAIYLNGRLASTIAASTVTGSVSTGTVAQVGFGDFTVGGASDVRYWSGLIESVKVWNRALSAGEVAKLYEQPYGLYLPSSTHRFYAATAAATSFLPRPFAPALQAVSRANTY